MFMVLKCSWFDDPNDIDNWEFENELWPHMFDTKEEAEEAIKAKFSFVKEDVEGIFTADCKDEDLGHWQVAEITNIKTSDKCTKEWWAF